MVNELRDLLRDNTASPPPDYNDLSGVLRGGRRRVRRRRLAAVGGTAVASAAVIGLTSVMWPAPPDLEAAGLPDPDAPTVHLADARVAVKGEDFRVLASYTNDNLERDNGQYFDGVTDDGLILFRDGPRMDQLQPRYALMDPATGEKSWLPDPPTPNGEQLWLVDLGAERLVLSGLRFGGVGGGADPAARASLFALVYDRDGREWRSLEWPDLPAVDGPPAGTLGPDGRLYVRVPATQGKPPAGGWPMGADGEADDADAEGDTYDLWSVSLADPSDVRDEGLTLGDLAFTASSMVWTDATNGDSGLVHVRDLETGEESSFDPRTGEKCNLLSFGATDEHIVMGQYCGTYAGGVRDDRVQVMTTAGEQVVTVQDSDIDGGLSGENGVVTVTSYQRAQSGTYVYDLETDRFLRLSDEVSQWGMGGRTPQGQLMWVTPENRGNGATQWLGELVD